MSHTSVAHEPQHPNTDSDAPSDSDVDADRSRSPIRSFAAELSDRAVQRITGSNAFLRGRIYARRSAVELGDAEGDSVSAKVHVKNQEQPYETSIKLDPEHKVVSQCSCSGWRGPTGHCKHVAALLIALRDRERPRDKTKKPAESSSKEGSGTASKVRVEVEGNAGSGTVTATAPAGKRRRSRRRRRGGSGDPQLHKLELVQLGDPQSDRDGLEAWLPQDAFAKPLDLEYRVAVRSASVTVSVLLQDGRSAVPVNSALGGFNAVSSEDRGVLRLLSRHTSRGKPAVAELRSEDAAEVLALLKGKRVLLEPASMEMRYADEPLRPTVELDIVNGTSLRVRVMFESGSRKFSLSQGAWFEGTPGFHVDTTEGVVRELADQVTPAWLQRLYRSPAMVQPMENLPRLVSDFIPRVAASLGAQLPDLTSVADVVDEAPSFELKADGDVAAADVRLKVAYGGRIYDVPVNGFPAPLAFVDPEKKGARPRVIRRDVAAEMTALQALFDAKLQVSDEQTHLEARGEDAVHFWTRGITTLPDAWAKFIPQDLKDVVVRNGSVTPQMRVSSGVDWLSLDMNFQVDGVAVDRDELRSCLEHNRRLVRLEDGSYAPVNEKEVREVMARLAEIESSSGARGKLPLSQAGRVQDLVSLVEQSTVTPKAKELFHRLEDVEEIPSVPKPKSLRATLRDYQKRGFNWLVFVDTLGSGGVLADDMGLGKTLQSIALILWSKARFAKEDIKATHLVVAPTSVVPNWQREIGKFAPSLKVMVWQGPNRFDRQDEIIKHDVVITSYALLRRDEDFLQGLDLQYAILDEAQHVKNPLSATAKSAKGLKATKRLALTGTPVENRLSEFWSIFDFVSPGLLGSLKSFEENFARPIDRGDMDTAARLRRIVHPFILRRTKSQVAPELPEKIEQEMVVPLADEQSKLYRQILAETRKSVLSEVDKKGVAKSQIQILAALTRLRQVACDPRLMKLDGDWGDEQSGKLGALREIVNEAIGGGHRVLVFSQFVEMLQIIRGALDEDQVRYEYLDGSTKDRLERVDAFNANEDVSVFLISLKAGGTGLNLTGADTVIHFDPWWNPAVEDQATDRAHRIGQTRVVSVYRLIARDTVEEKILQLSAKKRQLVSNVLSAEGSPLKGLTRDDINDLFS